MDLETTPKMTAGGRAGGAREGAVPQFKGAPRIKVGHGGVLTRSQLLQISQAAREGIDDATRAFHRRHWAVMQKDSKTGTTRLLVDEIEEDGNGDGGPAVRPQTAAAPPETVGTPKQRRLIAVYVGEGMMRRKGRKMHAPRPPPPRANKETPRSMLARTLQRALTLSSPDAIAKPLARTPSGRTPGKTPRSALRRGKAGSFFGEEEDNFAFQMRNVGGFADGGVGASNFGQDSGRALAAALGVPRGNVVKDCSVLAKGVLSWDATEAEKRERECAVHQVYCKAMAESLSFLGDLDLWTTWFHTLDYSAARRVCRSIVGLQSGVHTIESPLVSSSDVCEVETLTEWEVERLMGQDKALSVTDAVRDHISRLAEIVEGDAGGGRSSSFFLLRRGDAEGAEGLLRLARAARSVLREFRQSRMRGRDRWGNAKVLLPLSHFRGGGGGEEPRSRGGGTGIGMALRASLGGSVFDCAPSSRSRASALREEGGASPTTSKAGGGEGKPVSPGKRMRSRGGNALYLSSGPEALPVLPSVRGSANRRASFASAAGSVGSMGADLLASMQSPTKKTRVSTEKRYL